MATMALSGAGSLHQEEEQRPREGVLASQDCPRRQGCPLGLLEEEITQRKGGICSKSYSWPCWDLDKAQLHQGTRKGWQEKCLLANMQLLQVVRQYSPATGCEPGPEGNSGQGTPLCKEASSLERVVPGGQDWQRLERRRSWTTWGSHVERSRGHPALPGWPETS